MTGSSEYPPDAAVRDTELSRLQLGAASIAAAVAAGGIAWLAGGIVVWGVRLGGPPWWWQVFIVWMFAAAIVAAVAAVVVAATKTVPPASVVPPQES
ncbi:hypothetical protein [Mycolicibacterium sp. GF69]|uniref:hypothetical protein n=1 Tax=Mycolicibacterium sp. GF69 TaxID=2267251 RepID=UPI001057A32B|nr:hypothetical protein [Mycolicibacterium sp. GF69]